MVEKDDWRQASIHGIITYGLVDFCGIFKICLWGYWNGLMF